MKIMSVDQTKIDKFWSKMLGIINNSMFGLMTSIGYRTNLFEGSERTEKYC
jgi:hypothetical protein